MIKKTADGALQVEIMYPEDAVIPSYSVNQTGGWFLEALKKPELYLGTLFRHQAPCI